VKELIYISEIIFPSKSAYSIQVMKMCEAFSKKGFKVKLFSLDNNEKKYLHSSYNCSKKFEIKSFGINKNNFLNRLKYAFKIFFYLIKRKNKRIFYSRSVITGLLLNLFYKKIIIEIHHPLKSFTFFLFQFFKIFDLMNNISFVFISNNLKNLFKLKNKSIVLDDAVDFENYQKFKSNKKLNKTCVYTGSFSKGKGLETIIKISELLPNVKFHLYGDFSNSFLSKSELLKYKNIIYKGYVKNKKIPEILNLYYSYLMPYSKKVYVRSKNIEVGKYMSPLKLFEYLASSGVLFASDMKVYKHIINKNNSILIKNNSIYEWKKKITLFFKNKRKFNYLSKNATKLAKENTWQDRAEKIKIFLNVS
tara:strand:+ start:1819 stop:2907 length:1089 start_codon:yes stop_codon:yes gene_type:complete